MAAKAQPSPTLGKAEGTALLVRAYLVGHGPNGAPVIALQGAADQPLALVWINPAAIVEVGADPEVLAEERPIFIVHGNGAPGSKPTRFTISSDREALQDLFPTPEMAARWASENYPDAIVQLDSRTAEALGRDDTDRVLRS